MRQAIFAAARSAGANFNETGNIAVFDAALDQIGVPRDEPAAMPGLDKAIANIKRWEGCKLSAYPDPGTGSLPITIGWGSTRDEHGGRIELGTTWTQARADSVFADEVAEFAQGVKRLLGAAPTTPGQFAALVSFSYNVGLQALKESTLLRLHKDGDYEGAAGQFARWSKAGGRTLQGLVNRRAAEAAIYRGRA